MSSAAVSFAAETFLQRLEDVEAGSSREAVLGALGEPHAVVEKGLTADGRPLEVWRYLPAIHIPAQATLSAGEAGQAAVSLPVGGASTQSRAQQIRSEMESWERSSRAAISGSAPPSQKPNLSSRPPTYAGPPPPASRIPVYYVTFVDGVVRNVQYAEEIV